MLVRANFNTTWHTLDIGCIYKYTRGIVSIIGFFWSHVSLFHTIQAVWNRETTKVATITHMTSTNNVKLPLYGLKEH